MIAELKLLKPTISDEAMADLALELEEEYEQNLQLLFKAVLDDDSRTAKKLVRELQNAN